MPPQSALRRAADPLSMMDRNRTLLTDTTCYSYKHVDGQDLEAYAFPVAGEAPPEGRPAILFFYSSTWDTGLVSQFAPHCLYFANRGIQPILFDYRVTSRFPAASPWDAMMDVRSAIRWARQNAPELGLRTDRIVACGGSAGAHAALAAAMMTDGDDPQDDPAFSCVPDALILFSPILDFSKKGVTGVKLMDKKTARRADLVRQVRRHLPPMIIFHGTADRVVPFENSERFRRKMWWRGNQCRLLEFETEGHGFFNFNVNPRLYELTINESDAFLVDLKFLSPAADDDGTPRLAGDGRFHRNF
ncbi:MAG: alpha/beta hydrolase fold domain-containing protein [Verrucomicrobiota bacterium]